MGKRSKQTIFIVLLLSAAGFCALSYSWTFTDYGRLDYRAAFSLHMLSFNRKFKPRPDNDFELDMPVNLAYGFSMMMPRDKVARTEDRTIDGPESIIPIRIYWPEPATGSNDVLPALPAIIVYFHGGGFVVGDIDIFDPLTRSLSKYTQSIVISVDYRLAPEHPYPAAVDDAYTALVWAADNALQLGGDPDRLIVAGDSAGGTLAAVVSLKSRDQGGPGIAHQLLYYPGVDFVGRYPSAEKFSEDYGLPERAMLSFRSAYMGHVTDRKAPYLSPIYTDSHQQLPPALIVTAGFDPLSDSGKAYAEKLQQADVAVTHLHYPGMIHGFMGIVFFSQQQDALEKTASTLKLAFSEGLSDGGGGRK